MNARILACAVGVVSLLAGPAAESESGKATGTDDAGVLSKVAGWIGGRLVKSTDMFSIAIKPFMDRHSYDQDRVANCCHHITDTHGGLRSFCEYNALHRRGDSWARFPTKDQLAT